MRAALALTEAATVFEHGLVPDDVWDEAAAHFAEDQLAALVLAMRSRVTGSAAGGEPCAGSPRLDALS